MYYIHTLLTTSLLLVVEMSQVAVEVGLSKLNFLKLLQEYPNSINKSQVCSWHKTSIQSV